MLCNEISFVVQNLLKAGTNAKKMNSKDFKITCVHNEKLTSVFQKTDVQTDVGQYLDLTSVFQKTDVDLRGEIFWPKYLEKNIQKFT